MTDTSLIFLHVPRTSGSTLQNVMERHYRREEVHSAELFFQGDIQRFAALPSADRARIRLLKGHMAFGLHRHLPRPARYFTMVRDPIDRLISFYYYIRRRPTDQLHAEVMEKDVDLATFVESGMAWDHTDNSFVRFISGEPFVDMGAVDSRLLDQAKSNIKNHFVLTGSMERFDETVLLLKKAMGWSAPVYYRRENVTAGRPAMQMLDARTRSILERYTEVDRALVDYARARFEEQVSAMPEGFDREVRRFQQLNRLRANLYPALNLIRQRLRSASSR